MVIFSGFWQLPEENAPARGGDRAPALPPPHQLGALDARRQWNGGDGHCQKKSRPITISSVFSILPEENAPPQDCDRAPDPAFPTFGKP